MWCQWSELMCCAYVGLRMARWLQIGQWWVDIMNCLKCCEWIWSITSSLNAGTFICNIWRVQFDIGEDLKQTMYHQTHPVVELTQRAVSFADLHCTDVSFIDTLLTLHGDNLAKWSEPRLSNSDIKKTLWKFLTTYCIVCYSNGSKEVCWNLYCTNKYYVVNF